MKLYVYIQAWAGGKKHCNGSEEMNSNEESFAGVEQVDIHSLWTRVSTKNSIPTPGNRNQMRYPLCDLLTTSPISANRRTARAFRRQEKMTEDQQRINHRDELHYESEINVRTD